MPTQKITEQPKKRDYAAERERTKLNKQKAQGGTDAQPKEEPAKKAPLNAKTVEIIDDGHCGHVLVPLSQIVSDPNQPRKFFDMPALLELSKTIVKHGVIEPILIRPIPGGLFMIVFGERRFRGSLMAAEAGHDVTTIPAMIKEMTDDEALELQLIENLHRSNPHPIEDAFTFKKMLEKESVEDIALKIDKSTKFVAMRIALTNLSQKFQDLFFANKMLIGQAVTLSKITPEAQDAIFADEVPDNWKDDANFMLDDIERLVNRETKNIDDAPFNVDDVDLYKEMGACGKCKFNSANNLLLFADEKTSRICGNAVCFNIKSVRSYKANIEQVMTDPTVVFVAGGHYSDTDKQKVKDVQAVGATVLASGSWMKIGVDKKPEWEAYLKDEESSFDDREEDREEFEARIKVEYDEAVAEWQKDLNEVATARAEGKIKKAFIVVGNEEGKFVEVIATTPQAELIMGTGSAEGGGDPGIAIQIAEIQKREARNQELDGEKVWTDVRKIMSDGGFTTFIHGGKLKPIERAALAGAIYECLGIEKNEFQEEVLKLEDESGTNIGQAMEQILTDEHFNILCRTLIKEKLFPSYGSHLKLNPHYLGMKVAEEYFPDQVKNIKAEQAIKAEKRAQKVSAKIAELNEPEQP